MARVPWQQSHSFISLKREKWTWLIIHVSGSVVNRIRILISIFTHVNLSSSLTVIGPLLHMFKSGQSPSGRLIKHSKFPGQTIQLCQVQRHQLFHEELCTSWGTEDPSWTTWLLWPLKSTRVLYLSSSTWQPQDALGGWFMSPGCTQGCHFFSTAHWLYQIHIHSDPSQVSWLIVSWISHLDLWLSSSNFKETNITYLFNLSKNKFIVVR